MANGVLTCPGCRAVTAVAICPSCGGNLLADGTHSPRVPGDVDRAASEGDQTASDRDQTWSDRDQTSSESDQRSSDEDQRAADDEFAAGGDAGAHDRGTAARKRSSRDRTDASALRDESAADRGDEAAGRDRTADSRDAPSHEDFIRRAERDRARAATDRARAADDRARAAADRAEAARERAEAVRNRGESADLLRLATTDELTGAWTRKFGLEEALRELERAYRTGAPLVLAFVDVDGLKEVNDSQGHAAGDELLRRVGRTIRENVRGYDVLVRYGGDEFVCALPNVGEPDARSRFARIAAELKAVDPEHSISVGLAAAEHGELLADLIARADADLLRARRTG